MKVEIKGNNLVITMPIVEAQSKSGKSTVIASSQGNQPAGITYKDKPLIIGVNAYTKN